MGKTRRYSALGIAWLLLSLGSAEHAGASTELLVPAGQPVVLTGTQTHSGPVDKAAERPAGFSDQGQAQEASSVDHKAVLLWPKSLEQFQAEYPSWPQWLGSPDPYALALRDELLTSARALAAIIPDLSVEADQPDSDLIVVTGHPATVGALVERLRDHPLLAQVTGDSPAYREEARAAWRERAGNASKAPYPSSLVVNIRNTWVTNTVWGYAAPGMDVTVRVIRDSSHTLSTTATADDAGRYEAYFPWEIREGDVIELQTGTEERRIPVIPLRATDMSSPAFLLGVAGTGPAVSAKLDVTIGRGWQEVGVGREGAFRLDLQASPPTPGTRGFLAYRDPAGVRIFAPFATPVVNVRRDTSYGLPYGGAHSAGISSIVWGSATPGAALEVTLTRAESLLASRTTSADMTGYFSISVDRLIEDGDVIQVSDGASQRTVEAPTLTYRADPVARVVTGIGPPGIASTVPGAPHTLQVSLGGLSLQVTTTSEGEFTADFGTRPYFAGLLGAMQYITPEGDRVFKPVFVADPLVRGRLDDWRADVILGQPDFDQITPNEVVGNKLFNPSGVYVDRSSQPNRVYVYDAGNNRVLGLSHLGVCLGGANAGSACTSDSDCPASSCQIEADRAADLVLGQPSFTASACNGDSGIQGFPDTALSSASSLCGMLAEGVSILESGSAATMATDLAGNLYLPDIYNHRVLRYDDPFEKDRIADHAWGQTDFSGNHCNRGAAGPDNQSLCLAPLPSYGDIMSGVAIDAVGNLWVTDTRNSRVLRFPYDAILGAPAREADLVLGQPDFSTAVSGEGLSQMSRPTSVRVDASGVVYVADALSGSADKGRVLIFEPPFSNGMFASGLLGSGGGGPTGLEIDPAEGLWVNDSQYQGVQYFVDGTLRRTLNSAPGRIWGGIGVDRDGSVMVTGWDPQEVQVYSMPTYTLESTFLKADEYGFFNRTGSRGFHEGLGLEIAAGQLIYADSSRLLFWNNPWNPANYEPADGVLGEPDFQTREAWGPPFGRMRADLYGHLWVIQGDGSKAWVNGYSLPLSQGEEPIVVLSPPIPVQGGGETTWSWSLFLGGIDVQPSCDCLWLADKENHRVLRVRNVSSHPVIDVVLGQLDISGSQCNQGRGPNYPSRDSLCHPGGLAFDKEGNLFVADHNLETTGNWRLLEYDAGTIPDMPASAVFGVPATRVFGRGGDFSQPYCLPLAEDPVCGPWEPAFDASGRMVVAFNGYLGPRFPLIYQNPLNNPFPISALADFHSQPLSARFDPFGNLYVLDTTRHRILIYRRNEVQIYQLSGTIRTQEGDPIPGVSLETVGYASSAVTDGSGRYALMGLVTGTYEVVPSKNHYSFDPATRTVEVRGPVADQDFVGTYIPTTATITAPEDGSIIADLVAVEVEGTGDRVELYLDRALHGRASLVPAAWSWNTRQVLNGSHMLQVVPYDEEGRQGVPHSITLTVDNPATSDRWFPVGLPGLAVSDLALAPSDPQVLYAAAETGEIYKSLDAGMIWGISDSGIPDDIRLVSLAISPTDSNVVYAGNPGGGIYLSTDGGGLWSTIAPNIPAEDLAIAATDPEILFAAGWQGAYRSLDGGASWAAVLPGVALKSVAVDPSNPQVVYVGESSFAAPMHKTVDGGSSWAPLTVGDLNGQIQTILIDPHNTNVLYVGKLWGPGGVYKSTDGGVSWTRTGLESGVNTESLAMAPNDSQMLYAGNLWGGVFKTVDGGATWARLGGGLPSDPAVMALEVDPLNPEVVYAGLWNGGVWEYLVNPPAPVYQIFLPLILRDAQ